MPALKYLPLAWEGVVSQVQRICRSQSGLSVILKTITVCPPGEIPSLSGFTSFGCQIECSIISTDPADSPHGEHFQAASGGSGIHEPVWGVGISLSSGSSETGRGAGAPGGMPPTSAASVLLVNWLQGTFSLKAYIFHGQALPLGSLSSRFAPSSPVLPVWGMLLLCQREEGSGPGTQQSLRRQTSRAVVVASATHRTFQRLEFPPRSRAPSAGGAPIFAVQSSGHPEGDGTHS